MRIVRDIKDWNVKSIAATIGFFDGVHPGHRFMLDKLKRLAKDRGVPSAAVTFTVHPRIVLQSDYQPKLLNSFDEKIELLAETGIDYAIAMDFTASLAALSARDFMTGILSAQWHVTALLIGYDNRFGHLRADGFDEYAAYGAACGIDVVRAEPYSEAGIQVSSSKIRQLVESGDVAKANRLLGYRYRLKGRIVGGRKIGRSIGFPTANIAVCEPFKALPAKGAYAVYVKVGNVRHKGMLYIGTRPTVSGGDEMGVEVHIFDFNEDVYGEDVTVEFVRFVREDTKFDSLETLGKQLMEDKQKVNDILNSL